MSFEGGLSDGSSKATRQCSGGEVGGRSAAARAAGCAVRRGGGTAPAVERRHGWSHHRHPRGHRPGPGPVGPADHRHPGSSARSEPRAGGARARAAEGGRLRDLRRLQQAHSFGAAEVPAGRHPVRRMPGPVGSRQRTERLAGSQALLGRPRNPAAPSARPPTTMTLPIQNHSILPVMKLPGMNPRPCPANTAPTSTIRIPTTPTPALMDWGTKPGYPTPPYTTDFSSVYCKNASTPCSLPKPDCLVPPKGSSSWAITSAFTQVYPASSSSTARRAAAMLDVQIEEPSPNGVSLASLSASSRSLTRRTGSAGPKTSSVHMRAPSGTFSRIVGSMNQPFSYSAPLGLPPP